MPKQRRVVTQVKGWRQFALFPRAEIKALTLSRWQWIKQRLREESRQSAQQCPPEANPGSQGLTEVPEDLQP